MNSDIDIIIPWVDGSDPNWQKEFKKYCPDVSLCDARFERYREWELLKYWFRGIEMFAPWVRKIHFITCGHLPDWLDTDHPKLNIVLHEDYIPTEYLPVFSSHPIEIFINRIEGLADKFIYFNDDFFLISPINSDMFFRGDKPCDAAILNALSPGGISHIKLNDVEIINNHFCKKEVLFSHPLKWFNFKYGKTGIRTLSLLPWKRFTGFVDQHAPTAYMKKTLDKVWKLEESKLLETAQSRFRSITDINQYVFRYWRLCEGDFHPINFNAFYEYFELSDKKIDLITDRIRSQKLKILTINDASELDFNLCQAKLISAFNHILPEKSSFER